MTKSGAKNIQQGQIFIILINNIYQTIETKYYFPWKQACDISNYKGLTPMVPQLIWELLIFCSDADINCSKMDI